MNTELIKTLREKTAASMNECRIALMESGDDLEKAIDIITIKGQMLADKKAVNVAAEGVVLVRSSLLLACAVEVCSETDFVARSPEFLAFANQALDELATAATTNTPFASSPALEEARKALIAKTRENVVVRRWWVEESTNPLTRVFSYVHSDKLAAIITLLAKDEAQASSSEFATLGDDLAMQVAAMVPLAISIDQLTSEQVARQTAIFEEQVKEKPEVSRPKIIEGKIRKWHQEVALAEQDSITHPKKQIKTLLNGATIAAFHRCVVGDGIEVVKTDLAAEVAEMTGLPKHDNWSKGGECLDCRRDI